MRRTLATATVTAAVVLFAGLASLARGDAADRPAATSVAGMRLKVSPNGRYLVDQDGKPFFYLADTCWLLFQRLDHREVDEYLKDRAGKGFSVIQAYVIRGLGERHPDGNRSLLGESPFIDRDPNRPNEAYFRNVDHVVKRANDLGLVLGLVTSKSWHVNRTSERVFDEKNAYSFGRFLGKRYINNAVVWYPGGDSVPGQDDAVWVAMARGLRDGCEGRQLISYHGSGQTSSSTWYHRADWLDFNTIQSGHTFASDSYKFVSKDYAQSPAKPTIDMEPAYENHPTGAGKPRVDAHKVRTQAYIAMLAGAAGHAYGSLDLFWLYKPGDGPFPRDGFQDWRTAMNYPGARQMGVMRRLFEERPWYRLRPDQSVLASEPGDGPFRTVAARSEDGSFAIVYLPEGRPVSIEMNKLSGSTVRAQWYDPRDGTWTRIGEFPASGRREFAPESRGVDKDWALVLEDAAKDFPATGRRPGE
ncbi:MAG: glycoside hydrolase family 140 protein [Isosphaeraceae bacterium]